MIQQAENAFARSPERSKDVSYPPFLVTGQVSPTPAAMSIQEGERTCQPQ